MIIIGVSSAVNQMRLPQNDLRKIVASPSPITNSRQRLKTDMASVRPSASRKRGSSVTR